MKYRLSGGRIWDGSEATTSSQAIELFVDRGEIAAMGSPPTGESGENLILPPGSVVMPGLIDAHVHLDLDPHLMAPAEQFEASRSDRDLRMIARAGAMVRAGITTARDLGAGEWRELALRDARTPLPPLPDAPQNNNIYYKNYFFESIEVALDVKTAVPIVGQK